MKILKTANVLSVLTLTLSCSLTKPNGAFRTIAFSEDEKPTHTFRFYGKHEYLPTKMKIYERKFYAPVEINLETEDYNFLTCSGRAGMHSAVAETFSLTGPKTTIQLNKNVGSVECNYSGKNQHTDLKVTYELGKVTEVPISPYAEQLNNEQQLLAKLADKNWPTLLKELIQKNNLEKIIGSSVPASSEYIEFANVEEGDWINLHTAQGVVQYGISSYDYDGTTNIPSFDKTKMLFPDAKPYALICGSKHNSSVDMMIEGRRTHSNILKNKNLFCAINVKTKSIIKATGSFGVKLSHISKKTVEKILQDKIKLTQGQIAAWEDENTVKPEEIKANWELLGKGVQVLAAQDEAIRYREPPIYCSKTMSGETHSYKDIKRLVLGEVGKFCSSPVELKPNQYLTICDGDAKTHYSGDFVIFDANLKIINKTKLATNLDKTTISAIDVPLVRKDLAGKNYDFVLTTKDGKILFYDLIGKLKKTIKVDYEFIENPIMLPDGTMAALAYESLGASSQRLYYFNDVEIVKYIDLPDGNGFTGPYQLNENIYLSGYDGQVLGFSKEKEKFLEVMIEKEGRLSPPALLNESTLLVGTVTGKLFELDINTGEKKLFYRAQYTGETSYSFSTTKMEPLVPRLEFTPVVLKDGNIVVASSGDGRVHMLNSKGEVQWQVHTPIVSGLLNFAPLPKTDYFLTGSISYMTIVRPDGHILARYSNTGAENPYTPLAIGKNRFLSGMYNGVFMFELKPLPGTTTTELRTVCE